MSKCLRFYEKSFDYPTTPANNVGGLPGYTYGADAGGAIRFNCLFKAPKRNASYTVSLFNPGAGTAGQATYTRSGASGSVAVTIDTYSTNYWSGYALIGASALAGAFGTVHWVANARL